MREEIISVIKKMKCSKTAGLDGIVVEMLKIDVLA